MYVASKKLNAWKWRVKWWLPGPGGGGWGRKEWGIVYQRVQNIPGMVLILFYILYKL